MTPKVYLLDEDQTYKSALLTESEVHLSSEQYATAEQFLQPSSASGVHQISVPLQSISKVTYIERDVDVTLDYPDDPAGDGGATLEFEDRESAAEFTRAITTQQNMQKAETEEELTSALYATVPWLLGAVALLVVAILVDEEDIMDARTRRGTGIIKLIYGIVGQTGVILITGLASAFLAYQVFSRVNNRRTVYTYTQR